MIISLTDMLEFQNAFVDYTNSPLHRIHQWVVLVFIHTKLFEVHFSFARVMISSVHLLWIPCGTIRLYIPISLLE